MAENEVYDLVIVGGGPGGLSAGIYAMRAALRTILIEKGLTGGQINLTESVENCPGFENIKKRQEPVRRQGNKVLGEGGVIVQKQISRRRKP